MEVQPNILEWICIMQNENDIAAMACQLQQQTTTTKFCILQQRAMWEIKDHTCEQQAEKKANQLSQL